MKKRTNIKKMQREAKEDAAKRRFRQLEFKFQALSDKVDTVVSSWEDLVGELRKEDSDQA